MRQLLTFSLLTFVLFACKTIAPIVPETKTDAVPAITQKESSLYIPIKINLKPYLDITEKTLPITFTGKEDHCQGVSYSYKFTREPIVFEGKGDYLRYDVDGKYLLYINYCPECHSLFNDKGNCVIPRIYASCGVGEPMRRVSVAYTTKFKMNPNYTFKSTTNLIKFETVDPCEITVFSYDATGKLKKEVTTVLKDLEDDIDEQIASIDIRSDIEKVWKMLAEPTSLGKYGYFYANPKAVSLGDIRFNKKEAQVDLHLTLLPQIQANNSLVLNTKLPNLSDHKKSKGFNIDLDIVGTYDSLSSILTSELKGKSVMLKKNEVIFNAIEVQGAVNNKLSLKVNFGGKRSGTLYLVGTPNYDSLSQQISFPDLTFDIETKNALLKSAKWMFNSKITDVMRENARFDLKPHLSDIKKMVQSEMNRELTEGVKLSGKIDDIQLVNIFPSATNLIIRVNAKGDMKLSM